MYKLIRELYSQLSKKQKNKFIYLQGLVIVMSLLELVSIASIAPFMAVVSDPGIISSNETLNYLYIQLSVTNYFDFLSILGFVVLSTLLFSSIFSMYTVWKLAVFSSEIGTDISSRLYKFYMSQNWLYFTNASSAQLTKQVSTESSRVAQGIIEPLLQMNAKLVVAILIMIALILFNPSVALFAIILFSISYLVLFKVVRKKLQDNGFIISNVMTERFRLLNEGFGGIRDLMIYGRIQNFIDDFILVNKNFAVARGSNIAFSQVPRYLIELVAYSSVIGLILYLLNQNVEGVKALLPILSVYALSALKLLPALQQIYAGLSQVKGNISAYISIKEDLSKSSKYSMELKKQIENNNNFEDNIFLKDVCYSYENNKNIINSLSLEIKNKKIIGFTGPSGAGKSTIIDILLGLLKPQSGGLYLNSEELDGEKLKSYQSLIGFVPQDIFLSEGTIAQNIAFGVPVSDINYNKVRHAITLSQLDEFIKSLDDKEFTKVGERGVLLSGGQKQRIGIARALYNDPQILIFDEATSSLDNKTEKNIMESVYSLSGEKTIIMIAHRLDTIKKCDLIYYIESGKVNGYGTYDELFTNNSKFKNMVNK